MSNKIIIVDYDKNWKILFLNEKKKLKSVFQSDEYCVINHIGSTSVPNLASKPIIDISIGLYKLKDKDYYLKKLKKAHYSYCDGSLLEDWLLFRKTDFYRYHLHLMQYTSKRYKEQIIFRDILEKNHKFAKNYELTKKYLAKYKDPVFYSMDKLDFINLFFQGYYKGIEKNLVQ